MPGDRLTDIERGRILERASLPRSTVDSLCSHFKRSRQTILRVLGRLKPAARKKATGRCNAKRDRLIVTLARRTKTINERTLPAFPSTRAIAQELGRRKMPCSYVTVARTLHAQGLESYVRPKATTLDSRHFGQRLAFCNAWLATPALLQRLVFSDEHWITTNDHATRTMWAYSRDEVVPKESKNPLNVPSFMVWGAIGLGWRSELVFIKLRGPRSGVSPDAPRGMDAAKYVRICLSKVVPTLLARDSIFQQDGARAHTAKSTRAYLERKGVTMLESWPPYSPDLNPIEQLWKVLNERITDQYAPRTFVQLRAAAINVWNDCPQAVIDNFVVSFAKKIKACAAARGARFNE